MLREAHIHARLTVQVDGNHITKEGIKKAFDDKARDLLNGGRILTLSGEATHVIDEGEIYETEFEHKFVNLTMREGEREFDLRLSIQVEPKLSDDQIFDEAIKSWFGEPFEINGKGEYEYDGGEYVVYGSSIKPMTKFEFEIVSKFV
jgi:hypothetical protein